MFDIQLFCEALCQAAYPDRMIREAEGTVREIREGEKLDGLDPGDSVISNEWDWEVVDILGHSRTDGVVSAVNNIGQLSKDPYAVIITWSVAGTDSEALGDESPRVHFEIVATARRIDALNAFDWAVRRELIARNDVNLSSLAGDVSEDDLVGSRRRATGRASRSWTLTVEGRIQGMNYLFEERGTEA